MLNSSNKQTSHSPSLTAQELLSFWFGPPQEGNQYDLNKMHLWFGYDPIQDQMIKERFEYTIALAMSGALNDWKQSPEGRLALILIYDQFPRNMYRGTSQAFAYDALARGLALEGIEQGIDLLLPPIYRVFFYLPLEHTEEMSLQNLSVDKFQSLLDGLPESDQPHFKGFLDYAIQHQQFFAKHGYLE